MMFDKQPQPWMKAASAYIGTKEFPGAANNPVIIGWAKKLGGWIASWYKEDSIPWCGLFIAHVFQSCGMKVSKQPLSALDWLNWGRPCAPQPGALLIFQRQGGGHVGFYVSETSDGKAFNVLGANQSDAVNIKPIAKSRFAGARWPEEFAVPKGDNRIVVRTTTSKLSTNEA